MLEPGDRVADFMVPDQDREVNPIYDLVKGGPIVIHLYPDNARPDHVRERDAFIAGFESLKKVGVQLFMLNRDELATNKALAANGSWPFPVFTDPAGRVHAQLGVSPVAPGGRPNPEGALVTYVLDANMRVIAVFQGRCDRSHANEALAFLEGLATPSEPTIVSGAAPVLLIPRVIDETVCRRLIETWETKGNRESGTISTDGRGGESMAIRHQTKRRRDHPVTDSALIRELDGVVLKRIAPEVRRAFDSDIAGVEDFKIACYDSHPGGYFRPQRDNLIPNRAQRRFAVTLNLNDGYEGGFLRFAEYGPHLYRPEPGAACVFNCSLLHEATDVTEGRRFVLLFFLIDRNPARWRREKAAWFTESANAIEAGLREAQARTATGT
ncbi:MAG: redoxin domain-containing protein [Rhodospirillales bacterium]|nr:redoxin domain-containing protein [Rhodospirillales bacterium]